MTRKLYIRYWREQRGLKQCELAERAKIERSHLSRSERGLENVSLDYLAKIADVLDVTVTDLIVGRIEIQCVRVGRGYPDEVLGTLIPEWK